MTEEKLTGEFTIDSAIIRYNNIAYNYHNDIIDEDMARAEIELLNEKCKDNDIVFNADFKSLELHTRDENLDYSYDISDSDNDSDSFSW